MSDEHYLNKYPEDASDIALVVREMTLSDAVRLLELWGSKQRDIGAIKAIETFKEKLK